MPMVFTEIPRIEHETAQDRMSAGRDIADTANDVGRVSDSALDEHVLTLECRSCGARWASVPQPDGEFRHDFWRCPRGCDW